MHYRVFGGGSYGCICGCVDFSNKTFIGAVLPYIFSIAAHPCPQATADIETECAKTDIKKIEF